MKIEGDIVKTVLVVLVLVTAYGALVFWPGRKQNQAMADELGGKQAELDAMQRPDLAPVQAEIAALSAELNDRAIKLPKGDLDDRVLQHVSDSLIDKGISKYETSYRNPKFYKRFAVTTIDVSFSSGFNEAFEIIRKIETSGPPVRVERLEIAGDNKAGDTGYVNVSLQLSSFFLPTGNEEGGR